MVQDGCLGMSATDAKPYNGDAAQRKERKVSSVASNGSIISNGDAR